MDNPVSGIVEKAKNLPPWAWIGVVGGAFFVWYYMRNQNNAANSANTGGGSVIPNESGVGGMTPGYIQTPPPTNVPTAAGYADNAAWATAAVAWLIGSGQAGAVDAGTAVNKYLNSEKLTTHEKNLIDSVSKIRPDGIGPAPYPPAGGGIEDPVTTPPPTNTPPPPNNNPPAPLPAGPIPGWSGRTYQVQAWPAKGSTLSGIASIMYGNSSKWPQIYNANRDRVSNPNLIYKGTWLRIP